MVMQADVADLQKMSLGDMFLSWSFKQLSPFDRGYILGVLMCFGSASAFDLESEPFSEFNGHHERRSDEK